TIGERQACIGCGDSDDSGESEDGDDSHDSDDSDDGGAKLATNEATRLGLGHQARRGGAVARVHRRDEMIEVENVVPWSAMERAADPEPATGDIDVVVSDLARAVRFYSRVFGLLPARGAWADSFALIPVNSHTRLVIHDARAAVRRQARCIRRWAFVVRDIEHVRDMVWELGVKVTRDSGAPDHIYRWSNGRSLYVQAPDGHEIELVEMGARALGESPARAAAS